MIIIPKRVAAIHTSTVIMGTTVFYGAFLVLMVIIVDLLYGLIDPRMRLE